MPARDQGRRRAPAVSGLAILAVLSLAACTKRWTRTETYGAFQVVEHFTRDRFDSVGTSQTVDHWTVRSAAASMDIAKAWFHPWRTALLVETSGDWQRNKADDLFLPLDSRTGKMLQLEHSTCPTAQTPFGTGLVGKLQDPPSSEPVSFLLYRDRTTRALQALCMVEFSPETDRFSAVKLPSWPSRFGWPSQIERLTSTAAVAVGCQDSSDPLERCALIRLDEEGARVLQVQANVDPGDLVIVRASTGPVLGRRRM